MIAIGIPPIPELRNFEQSFHLALVHLLADPLYKSFMKERSRKGDYIILDNSAYENGGPEISNEEYFQKAMKIGAGEIVAPDVLGDSKLTLQKSFNFLEYVKKANTFPIRFMLVPQGRTVEEWEDCFFSLIERHSYCFPFRRPVIGVPRITETLPGGVYGRVNFLTAAARETPSFMIHLLGWGRQMETLPLIARDFPHVRSIDSAKPFHFALEGITLTPHIGYVGRPKDYFERYFTREQFELAERNCKIFRGMANP
jgi:hypothetical protein